MFIIFIFSHACDKGCKDCASFIDKKRQQRGYLIHFARRKANSFLLLSSYIYQCFQKFHGSVAGIAMLIAYDHHRYLFSTCGFHCRLMIYTSECLGNKTFPWILLDAKLFRISVVEKGLMWRFLSVPRNNPVLMNYSAFRCFAIQRSKDVSVRDSWHQMDRMWS